MIDILILLIACGALIALFETLDRAETAGVKRPGKGVSGAQRFESRLTAVERAVLEQNMSVPSGTEA